MNRSKFGKPSEEKSFVKDGNALNGLNHENGTPLKVNIEKQKHGTDPTVSAADVCSQQPM